MTRREIRGLVTDDDDLAFGQHFFDSVAHQGGDVGNLMFDVGAIGSVQAGSRDCPHVSQSKYANFHTRQSRQDVFWKSILFTMLVIMLNNVYIITDGVIIVNCQSLICNISVHTKSSQYVRQICHVDSTRAIDIGVESETPKLAVPGRMWINSQFTSRSFVRRL